MAWEILLFIFTVFLGLCLFSMFLGMTLTIWRDLLRGW